MLRRVELGEADWVVTLFTRDLGRVSAIARGARKSTKRFAGALEPFFTVRVRLTERPRSELMVLTEASIVTPRLGLISDLTRLEVAGRALGWIRRAAPPRTPEPRAWELLERLLDRLAALDAEASAERELCELGLPLLGAFGWGIEFERCVSCGKPCPESAGARVDPTRGGLVCSKCGGTGTRLNASTRLRLLAAALGQADRLLKEDIALALELIERAFWAHAGVES